MLNINVKERLPKSTSILELNSFEEDCNDKLNFPCINKNVFQTGNETINNDSFFLKLGKQPFIPFKVPISTSN